WRAAAGEDVLARVVRAVRALLAEAGDVQVAVVVRAGERVAVALRRRGGRDRRRRQGGGGEEGDDAAVPDEGAITHARGLQHSPGRGVAALRLADLAVPQE